MQPGQVAGTVCDAWLFRLWSGTKTSVVSLGSAAAHGVIRMANVCELQVEVTWTGQDTALIALCGDLDFTTASLVTAAGDVLRDRSVARLVIDLSGVSFCDSSGMAALVTLWRIVHSQCGVTSLIGMDRTLAERLDRFGLTKLFETGAGTGDLMTA